jgi:PBP1b-binding outer membrane lipoprotein LpoB
MKLASILSIAILVLFFAGCASRAKNGARTYEGDSSPHLRMFEENSGGPLGR